MKRDWHFYLKLFQSTFTLSAFTFGGGCVIVPLMRRKFVNQLHWLEEEEMLNLSAIAQSAPGPLAVNVSILLGFHLAGLPGAAVSILGTILPPFFILAVVSAVYSWFKSNPIIALLLRGMQAGVAAVVVDVALSMAGTVLGQGQIRYIGIMIFALIALLVFKLNILLVLLVGALVSLSKLIFLRLKERRVIPS